MSNISPASPATFDDVYQIETTDTVLGGSGGTANTQAQSLVNRTQYLLDIHKSGQIQTYDSTYQSTIGGYPKGAVIGNSSSTGFWFNLADNNTTNPESAGSNWLPLGTNSVPISIELSSSNVTLTGLQADISIIVLTGTLTANITVTLPAWNGMVWSIVNNTTGAFSISLVVSGGSNTVNAYSGSNLVYVYNSDLFKYSNIEEYVLYKLSDTTAGDGANLVNFKQTGSTLSRSVQNKLLDNVSVLDFPGVDNTGVTDSTSGLQAAIDSGAKTIYFPEGNYLFNGLTVTSNQTLVGAGKGLTVLELPSSNITSPATVWGLKSTSDLSNFTLENMSIKGNLNVQTTNDSTGQGLFGLYLRGGSLDNIKILNCEITNWGAQSSTTGGGLAFGALSGSSKDLVNIEIKNCDFKDNGNVPGVYIGATSNVTNMQNIRVHDNTFTNTTAYASQNMVYILGTTTLTAYDVKVDRNYFLVEDDIDTCIELNYTNNFNISDNTIQVTGTANASGILIRGNCLGGTIIDNNVVCSGTGSVSNDGITIINHNSGEIQQLINISGNLVDGFGAHLLQLNSQCKYITVSGNSFVSNSKTASIGISIAATSLSSFIGNVIGNCKNAFQLSTGSTSVRNIDILNNSIDNCGSSSYWIIDSPVVSQDVQYLLISGNNVTNSVSGTSGFASTPYQASTGNIIDNNYIDLSNYFNPSYAAYIEKWSTPFITNGYRLNGRSYTFAQGGLSFAVIPNSGSTFTIGGNLDSQSPDANVGDHVLVSCDQSLAGVGVTGFVLASGQVRINVTNLTNATYDFPAANWTVIVI